MVEILWNSNAPHSSLRDHELVELRLVDVGNSDECRYLVREIHASWSAAEQQIEWKGFRDWTYKNSNEAQRTFANQKTAIVEAGFPYSTTLS